MANIFSVENLFWVLELVSAATGAVQNLFTIKDGVKGVIKFIKELKKALNKLKSIRISENHF